MSGTATRKPRDPNAPKRTRAPSKPKVVFILAQIVNDDGTVRTDIGKANVRVLAWEKSADAALAKLETTPGAFYMRGEIPAGR